MTTMYKAWRNDLQERAQELFTILRQKCLDRGNGGIKQLSVVFRRMDIDYSHRLSIEELARGVKMYGLEKVMNEDDIKIMFLFFDQDEDKTIDFQEFMVKLRPPMSESRTIVINEAYDKLDHNNDGCLTTEDIKVVCAENAKRHPKFLSGEWTEEQVFRNFLDGFDTPDDPDGIVTRDEFMNYYAVVSSMFDDDQYFDLMMRSVYGLPPKGSRKKSANRN